MTVTLDKVSKSFGSVTVLHDLDLAAEDGEFLVLLGASGCGKTTALRMVAGLEAVSAGRILIDGRDVTEVLPKNRDVAMVFQSYALYPHMSVAENIGYPLKIRGMNRRDREVRVQDVADQVQLGQLLGRYPRQLSGGQRQRVALARAMVRRPAVFLMDEPLSNLDAKLRGHMRAELKHMQARLGVTTIYVTHDQVEAMTLAHRVALMDKGVVQQLASPKDIYNDPETLFVAQFIGSPPMNVLAGRLEAGTFRRDGGAVATRLGASLTDAVLGVRPEDCRIVAPEGAALAAAIYATELLGDHSLVTVESGADQIVVKAPKDFAGRIDDRVGVDFSPESVFLFDGATGRRVR